VTSPFIGGLVVALLTFTASLSVVTLRNSPTDRALAIGTIGLASGVALTLIGAALGLAPLLLLGTIISGVGFGAAFLGTLQAILPLAAADERAGLLSAFYVESYLAFSLPVILGGLSVPALGLLLTTYIYGAIVILLALMSLLATRLSRSGISGGRRRDPDLRSYRLSPMQTSSPAGTTRVESALEQLLQMILHRAMEIAALPAGQREFHYRRIHESCCDAAKQIGQSADQSADTAQKMTDFARAIVAMIDIGERGRRS
jgi:hypothetical protein